MSADERTSPASAAPENDADRARALAAAFRKGLGTPDLALPQGLDAS